MPYTHIGYKETDSWRLNNLCYLANTWISPVSVPGLPNTQIPALTGTCSLVSLLKEGFMYLKPPNVITVTVANIY